LLPRTPRTEPIRASGLPWVAPPGDRKEEDEIRGRRRERFPRSSS
jgi:hypothetical protein